MARQEVDVSDQADRNSDLVEIAKRNGDFQKHYGAVLGALLLAWFSHVATRGRPMLRMGWIIAGLGLATALVKSWS